MERSGNRTNPSLFLTPRLPAEVHFGYAVSPSVLMWPVGLSATMSGGAKRFKVFMTTPARSLQSARHLGQSQCLKLAFSQPVDASRIQTDKEHRVIKAEMERGSQRDVFEFLPPQFAVTITELLRAMNAKPNIVHFSGHGDTGGITITKDDNQSQLLTAGILERLFRPLKGVAEIIVLNSCYSASQAESISRLGMYVVGNNLPVGDQAAISFAKGLYNGLSEGKSFEEAVNDARIVVMAESSSDSAIVEVWKGGNKLHI